MSYTQCEHLRNVRKGRSDWKVCVRVIRQWKGVTKTGTVWKGFNLLLLDAKNCRMHTFVPQTFEEKFQRIIQLGNMYVIKNFQVKDYAEHEKYRPVQMDRQIIFTADTKVKDLEANEIFIPKNMFDLFEYDDLKEMAKQQLYLADVIGIIQQKEICNRIPNKQVNIKFKISDGKKNVNVTFWDSFAEAFENELHNNLEEPIIIIIASAKVSTWRDEVDICNYSATRFYLNYDHHSVAKLRQRMKDPNFCKQIVQTKKPIQLCTVRQIKDLGEDFVGEEVACTATITVVKETNNWKRHLCSSCYEDIEFELGKWNCKKCKRIVVQTMKRFHISAIAKDETGEIELILEDREVRSLTTKFVEEVETKEDNFPQELKEIEGKDYTMIIAISTLNVYKKDNQYLATNIALRLNSEQESSITQLNYPTPQTSITEPSGSSYHLDDISQMMQ